MAKGALSGIRQMMKKYWMWFIVLLLVAVIYNMNNKYEHLANTIEQKDDENKEKFSILVKKLDTSGSEVGGQGIGEGVRKTDFWYPNMGLPEQVIGCGGRRGACMGGTQIPIPNILPPVDISERNIAPVTLTTQPYGYGDLELRQVGVIQKLFGTENEVYPLYGRKQYYNKDKWEYYTVLGPSEVMVPVITKNNYGYELGTNENVMIQGNTGRYRTIIYERDYPRYIPNVY